MDWKFRVALFTSFYGIYLLISPPAAMATVCGADWQAGSEIPEDIIGIGSVVYGDGKFVATAGIPGGFLTSQDGLNWTWHKLYGTQTYRDITWGGGQFVAVKRQTHSTQAIQTSPDGENWIGYNPDFLGTSELNGVTWGGGMYVAVGGLSGYSLTAYSSDGKNWTHSIGSFNKLHSVTWDGDQFVAVGDSYLFLPATIITSPDGITWTERDPGVIQNLYDVTWNGNILVAVGAGNRVDSGIKAAIVTSTDGVNWYFRDSGTAKDLRSVIWGDNQFVAVGLGGTIITSPDGITWTERNSGTSQGLDGVAWGNNRFVAVGPIDTTLISLCTPDSSIPNLIPYKPSNWSDKIVISTVKGTNTDSSNLLSNDMLYVDWAIENSGTAVVSSPFSTTLYINGTEKESWTTTSLDLTNYLNVKDYDLGTLKAGTHQIKIVTDSNDDIEESKEDDNFYTKSITIAAPSTQPTYVTGQAIVDFAGHENLSVADATVEIEGTWLITQTDNDGNFNFDVSDLDPGDYNLKISSFGLGTYAHSINIADEQSIDLESVKMAVEAGRCTEEELDQAADVERIKWDAKGDGLIGIEEAIHALQVVAGHQ